MSFGYVRGRKSRISETREGERMRRKDRGRENEKKSAKYACCFFFRTGASHRPWSFKKPDSYGGYDFTWRIIILIKEFLFSFRLVLFYYYYIYIFFMLLFISIPPSYRKPRAYRFHFSFRRHPPSPPPETLQDSIRFPSPIPSSPWIIYVRYTRRFTFQFFFIIFFSSSSVNRRGHGLMTWNHNHGKHA